MEKSLKRWFDFRLVYDSLANSSGLVRLELLLAHWRTDSPLSRACESFWRRTSTADGFLDWEGFSGGLRSALKDRSEKRQHLEPGAGRRPVAQVTSGEIERFLSSCHPECLAKGLAKAGREMHRWQVSIQKQETQKEVAERERAGGKQLTSVSVAREREELLRGAEVLENTQRWFQNRMAVLSAEEQQRKTHKLGPKEILAEMDEEESMVLHHLRQINSHLSSLALEADSSPSTTQLQSSSRSQPAAAAVVEYPNHRVRMKPVKMKEPQLHHSISLPVGASSLPRHHPPPSRPLHRSSSFSDRAQVGSQPMRQASSMTALTQQVTDYPGHRASPALPRPIRHSSSVQSLPGKPHPLPRPAQRAHSTRSLTRDHQLISEVL